MKVEVEYKSQPITNDELACVYAALILADDDIPVTVDKIKTLLAAAEVEVEPFWPGLFVKALQGVNIKELISGTVALGGGVAVGGGGGAGVSGAPETEEKPETTTAPVEEEDDSDEDFGLNLFD